MVGGITGSTIWYHIIADKMLEADWGFTGSTLYYYPAGADELPRNLRFGTIEKCAV